MHSPFFLLDTYGRAHCVYARAWGARNYHRGVRASSFRIPQRSPCERARFASLHFPLCCMVRFHCLKVDSRPPLVSISPLNSWSPCHLLIPVACYVPRYYFLQNTPSVYLPILTSSITLNTAHFRTVLRGGTCTESAFIAAYRLCFLLVLIRIHHNPVRPLCAATDLLDLCRATSRAVPLMLRSGLACRARAGGGGVGTFDGYRPSMAITTTIAFVHCWLGAHLCHNSS